MSDTVRFESPQTKLLQEWDRGYQENNLDIIDKFLYKDFNFVLYPRSLGSRELNREEYLKTMAGVFSAGIKLYDFVYHSIVEVPGKVVIHHSCKSKGPFGSDAVRESIYIADIVADGDGSLKIKRLQEFTDSKLYFDLIKASAAAKADA